MSTIRRIVMAMFVFAAVATVATAQEDGMPLSFDFSLDSASQYVWRGQPLNDEGVLQPSFTVSGFGVSLNWWGNFDTSTGDDGTVTSDNFSEHDWTISYGIDIPDTPLSAEIGAIYYYFPRISGDNSTNEAYVSLAADVLLAPSITVYYDYDFADGFYITAGIEHSIALDFIDPNLSLDGAVSVGWADSDYNMAYFGIDDGAFNDVTASLGLSYAVNESFSVGASLVATEMLDSDIEAVIDANPVRSSGNLFYVLSMSVSF